MRCSLVIKQSSQIAGEQHEIVFGRVVLYNYSNNMKVKNVTRSIKPTQSSVNNYLILFSKNGISCIINVLYPKKMKSQSPNYRKANGGIAINGTV